MEGKRLERRENKGDEDDEQKVRKVDTIHVHISLYIYSPICPELSTPAAVEIN